MKTKGKVKSRHTDTTAHILSSEANKERLQNVVDEMSKGIYHKRKLIEK
ncbi:hypothetical protein [Mucilaginibacter sp.]|jgi:hypothetical protein|nr:hypothetical protein [Mucilaginibacter sp.]HTI61020.1 hypothetical protein [Mucilaginibacter sp.]